jgi:hypothetical protein
MAAHSCALALDHCALVDLKRFAWTSPDADAVGSDCSFCVDQPPIPT